MLKDNIQVAKGFQTSVNIAYDLHDDNKVQNFIPTMSSLDIIEDVLRKGIHGIGENRFEHGDIR